MSGVCCFELPQGPKKENKEHQDFRISPIMDWDTRRLSPGAAGLRRVKLWTLLLGRKKSCFTNALQYSGWDNPRILLKLSSGTKRCTFPKNSPKHHLVGKRVCFPQSSKWNADIGILTVSQGEWARRRKHDYATYSGALDPYEPAMTSFCWLPKSLLPRLEISASC